jgi:hypothetical protein
MVCVFRGESPDYCGISHADAAKNLKTDNRPTFMSRKILIAASAVTIRPAPPLQESAPSSGYLRGLSLLRFLQQQCLKGCLSNFWSIVRAWRSPELYGSHRAKQPGQDERTNRAGQNQQRVQPIGYSWLWNGTPLWRLFHLGKSRCRGRGSGFFARGGCLSFRWVRDGFSWLLRLR